MCKKVASCDHVWLESMTIGPDAKPHTVKVCGRCGRVEFVDPREDPLLRDLDNPC